MASALLVLCGFVLLASSCNGLSSTSAHTFLPHSSKSVHLAAVREALIRHHRPYVENCLPHLQKSVAIDTPFYPRDRPEHSVFWTACNSTKLPHCPFIDAKSFVNLLKAFIASFESKPVSKAFHNRHPCAYGFCRHTNSTIVQKGMQHWWAKVLLYPFSILIFAVLAALTSIQPNKLTVNLTYNIDGQKQTVSPPCTQQAPGSACLAKPHAIR